MNVDLHCHSHYSDGSLPPTEVVKLAANNGVEMMALTDHDSVQGLKVAEAEAQTNNIKFINGIEFSTTWIDSLDNSHTLHIVGLNIDKTNPDLLACIQANQAERIRRAEATFEQLLKLDIDVSASIKAQIPDNGLITRTHIARALIDEKYVKNYDQAFKKYLGKGKRAFVAGEWQNLETVVKCIKAAGGVSVIAHPMRYRMNATRLSSLAEDFAELGGNGIEVVTATQDVNQQARAAQLAKQNGLHCSIGSDFHSLDQPWAMLGRCNKLPKECAPIWKLFT